MALRRLVAGLSSRPPGSDSRPDQQRSVVYEVVLGQVFLRVPRYPPVNIIPPTLRTHLHFLCTCCSYHKHEWVNPGDLHQVMLFRTSRNTGHGTPTFIANIEEHWTCYTHVLFRTSRKTGHGTPTFISDIKEHWTWYSHFYFGHRGTLDSTPTFISDTEEHWTWYSHVLFRKSRNTGHGTPTCYFGHLGTLDMVLSRVISDIEKHWT
jgi:hypothetical protein